MQSIWNDTCPLPTFPSLEGDAKTDVLIIGGGIAGILCAHLLLEAGVEVMLVEADRIGNGVTQYTTAKITAQHGLVYHQLVQEFGVEKAKLYLDANLEACREYEKLSQKIDCDYEKKDSYVYSLTSKGKLEQELTALEQLGYHARYAERLSLPMPTAGAVVFRNQAQFHPFKLLSSICKSIPIYEHTKITALGIRTAETNSGLIQADHIIVATHFPILNKHGAYYLKMFQSRSYVLGLSGAQNVDGMYIDEDQKGMSFRNAGDLLLLGGGGHRTGKDGGNFKELIAFVNQYYPLAKEQFRMATQDCMTLDHVPYIGLYGRHTEALYVATGYNKWGISSAMVSAMLLRDQILQKQNPYATIFDPHRTMLRPQLIINGLEAITNLLTLSTRRCPHLGCALKWNEAEHTWDCPCHGSRFTPAGKLINNPATDDHKGII